MRLIVWTISHPFPKKDNLPDPYPTPRAVWEKKFHFFQKTLNYFGNSSQNPSTSESCPGSTSWWKVSQGTNLWTPKRFWKNFTSSAIYPQKYQNEVQAHTFFRIPIFFIRNVRTIECRYISKGLSEIFICGFGDPAPFFEHFAGDKSICVYLQNALGVRSASSGLSKIYGNRQHHRNFWSKFLFRFYVF